jgi:arylsulfatase A-like enzyme
MLRAVLALLALVGVACAREGPPNVLLVTLDTTRADRLGPYGFAGARTPNLDRFASTAVVYERAYSSSSWTLPSHASLFTGLLPMQHGAQTAPGGDVATLHYSVRPLGPGFETLAERLAGAGYFTAAVVGGPAMRHELGLGQGFARYDDALEGPARIFGRRAEDVAARAIALLREAGDRPWLLFVNFFDPHAPYEPPPPFDRGLPEVDSLRFTQARVKRLVSGETPAPEAWEGQAAADLLARYDAEIAYMDAYLGRLLAALPDTARTLVAITSDHGESFGEHDYVSHGAHLYEDNVRVPLIVRWPDGRGAGTRVADSVPSHGVFAEILAAVGLPVPDGVARLDGRAPIVTEVGASENNVRMFGPFFDRDLLAFYAERDKLIASSRGEFELYDVVADPGELRDLAPERGARVAELRGQVDALRRARPPLYEVASRSQLSSETEEALRALGYLGEKSAGEGAAPADGGSSNR